MPTKLIHHANGIRIEGKRFAVGLYIAPERNQCDGEIAVTISKLPSDTQDRGTRLHPEEPYSFKVCDIKVEGNTLTCMAVVSEDIPEFRFGHILELEEGMAECISKHLPALHHASNMALSLLKEYEKEHGDVPWPHRRQYINSAAAVAILFGEDFYRQLEMLFHDADKENDFRENLAADRYKTIVETFVREWQSQGR